MVFSSLIFIFAFLPIFLVIYYLAPKKLKNLVLLFFSLLFYAWGEPKYIIILLLISFINYLGGLWLEKRKDNPRKRKHIITLIIISNILILTFFKYTNFFIDNLNRLGFEMPNINIVLPLGISFFTFQAMSYAIDLYYGKVKVEKNFLTFLTYVSMFPQLVAGPIVRYEDVAIELKNRKINFNLFCEGLFIFLIGLFKKVLIANNVGYLYSLITNDISEISVMTSWLGILAFSLQIYFDFSGYSTMAIGLGKMLGFNYPENFNYPYIATSITDFWRRWHITLSGWFRDYVYIPLGGNRCSKICNIRNLIIVWALTGIWHGAAWNYILWGIYFGIILIIEKYLLKDKLTKLPKFMRHLYAIILIMIGWVIFSIEDISTLKIYFGKMFINDNFIDREFIFYLRNYFVFIVSGILFSMPIFKNIKINMIMKMLIVIVFIVLFIMTIAMLISDSYNPFLYFRF